MTSLDVQGTGSNLRKKLATLTAQKKKEILQIIQQEGSNPEMDDSFPVETESGNQLPADFLNPEFISNNEVLSKDVENIDSIVFQITKMKGRLESFQAKFDELSKERSGLANEDAVSVGAYTRADSRRTTVLETQINETKELLEGANRELNDFVSQLEKDLAGILEGVDHPRMTEIQDALSKITDESIRHQMMNLATRELARRKKEEKTKTITPEMENHESATDDEVLGQGVTEVKEMPNFVEISPAGEIVKEEKPLSVQQPERINQAAISVQDTNVSGGEPIGINISPSQNITGEPIEQVVEKAEISATLKSGVSVESSVAPVETANKEPLIQAVQSQPNPAIASIETAKPETNQAKASPKPASTFDKIKFFLSQAKKKKDLTTDELAGL